jgi:transposase
VTAPDTSHAPGVVNTCGRCEARRWSRGVRPSRRRSQAPTRITQVTFHGRASGGRTELRPRALAAVCAYEALWPQRADARSAALMHLSDVRPVPSFIADRGCTSRLELQGHGVELDPIVKSTRWTNLEWTRSDERLVLALPAQQGGCSFVPRTSPPYPEAFRREAVELVRQGRTVRVVAESLGVSQQSLRNWGRRRSTPGARGGVDVGRARGVRRLRRENARLRQEREILKRAPGLIRYSRHCPP